MFHKPWLDIAWHFVNKELFFLHQNWHIRSPSQIFTQMEAISGLLQSYIGVVYQYFRGLREGVSIFGSGLKYGKEKPEI